MEPQDSCLTVKELKSTFMMLQLVIILLCDPSWMEAVISTVCGLRGNWGFVSRNPGGDRDEEEWGVRSLPPYCVGGHPNHLSEHHYGIFHTYDNNVHIIYEYMGRWKKWNFKYKLRHLCYFLLVMSTTNGHYIWC